MTTDAQYEIRNLLARDLHITDGRGSLEECLELWTDDCLWESPVAGRWMGHDGVLARHAKYREMGIQGPGVDAFHVLTTVDVRVDGDEAVALSTWLLVVDAGTKPSIQDIGTFQDQLRKSEGRWRIASRIVSQGTGEWLAERESGRRLR